MVKKLGELLLARGALTSDLLVDALTRQQHGPGPGHDRRRRLGEILLADGLLDEEALYSCLAEQWGLPFQARIPASEVDVELLEKFPLEHLRRHLFAPLHKTDHAALLAVSDPTICGPLDEAAMLLNAPLHIVILPPTPLLALLHEAYGKGTTAGEAMQTLTVEGDLPDSIDQIEVEDVLASANKAPVIKFVNTMIFQALRDRASDIHLELSPEHFRIRFRIDGVLHDRLTPPRSLHPPVTSRIKIMAGLDIAERRLPQDGKTRVKFADREVDIRVSSVPSNYGERVVLRLLDRKSEILTLEQMGMEPDTLSVFSALIDQPTGLLLVTGPTGSGKTTTIYGAIMRIITPDINIITLEDPVEYELAGVSQIPVKPKIGFTFAAGLRSLLRQDPDVIMVGEIRDDETATMAIQASLTGHLVFSTLHTNDAASAAVRLIDMHVEPFLVSSTLIGVLAQRLVRRLCPPCEECHGTGFRGRLGLFELMSMNEELSKLVGANAPIEQIRTTACHHGMLLLHQDGMRKVAAGLTTSDEVERVCRQTG